MDKTNAKSSKLRFMYGALEEVADEKITLNKEGTYKKEETKKQ